MKRLLILGAGTAGTMVANHLRNKLPGGWSMAVIDPEPEHLYQPDLLFIPFGTQIPARAKRPRAGTLRGIDWIQEPVAAVEPDSRHVVLENGERLPYDLLVLATGSRTRPEETEGLTGSLWRSEVHDFYTLEGATALHGALENFKGGRLVLNIVEMPIKCPVAPLEFAFLADDYFKRRGMRDEVELVYVTPLDGAFTKPIASREFGGMLEERGISVESEFNASAVDNDHRVLRSWDERAIDFDMLVTIPTHGGAPVIGASGLGDELDFVPTDKHTLAARDHDGIFVLGDATNLPASKAGSVAHFQAEVLVENLLRVMDGRSPVEGFDGHSNCFIESGAGKAMLIDFNYDVEPLPGKYPLPLVGPMSLMKETRINHLGKLGFRWAYWNMLLPARPMPIGSRMSLMGKDTSLLNPTTSQAASA